MTKEKSQHSNTRWNSISHFSFDFDANRRRWHICFILALSTLTGSSEMENKIIRSERLHWEADREMVREGERREWSIAGVKETALWLRPETWCHPERMPECWKRAEREGPASDHFTGMSRMFGHSSVLHKHHWSLNPPLPPCQGRATVLAQTKYMDVCVLDSLPIYVYQQTSIYQWD